MKSMYQLFLMYYSLLTKVNSFLALKVASEIEHLSILEMEVSSLFHLVAEVKVVEILTKLLDSSIKKSKARLKAPRVTWVLEAMTVRIL